MVLDETLAEDPELVRAAVTATLVAIENGALEGELRASRARLLEVSQAERERIQRELHDSAQQRLLALRIHLTLAGEKLEHREDRAVLQRLDDEVELAIQELRGVAHGSVPPILRAQGLGPALQEVAQRSPMPVRVETDEVAAPAEALESAVYFCCLEGLQNVAKHAGRGAWTTVQLTQHDGRVVFSISDDGVGFDPAAVEHGAGLTNLADRVGALGGSLRIDSAPGPRDVRRRRRAGAASAGSGRQTRRAAAPHHPARVMRAPAGQRQGGSDPLCSRRRPHPRRPKA